MGNGGKKRSLSNLFFFPHSPLPTPYSLYSGVRGVEFLQFVHMQLLCADDLFQPEDQRRIALSRLPRFDVSVERLELHLQIVSEHLREIFAFADFGRFDGLRSAERYDLIAQILRVLVRLAARRGEEWGELLSLLPRHEALLLKVLNRRGVFQRQRAVQPVDQFMAITIAPIARALAILLLLIFFAFSHIGLLRKFPRIIMNGT